MMGTETSHPDDNAEVFEIDGQMVGGYYVFEWRDIADYLRSDGDHDLANHITAKVRGRVPHERMNLARSQEDRDLIKNAAAVIGV